MENRVRELALFNLGIDSKLRGCDLVGLKIRDICHGDQVATRAMVMQHKTQRPVQFEITPGTRDAVQKWIKHAGLEAVAGRVSELPVQRSTSRAPVKVSFRGERTPGTNGGQTQVSVAAVIQCRNLTDSNQSVAAIQLSAQQDWHKDPHELADILKVKPCCTGSKLRGRTELCANAELPSLSASPP